MMLSTDAGHMALYSRVWQFMFGFLAYFVYESKIFGQKKGWAWVVNVLLIVDLLIFLLVDLRIGKLKRLD
jgi:hypothetical protein